MGNSKFWPAQGRGAATGVFSRGYVENKGLRVAPQVGFEPTTLRLTAESSGALFRNIGSELHPVPLRGSAKTQWPGSGEQPVSVALGLARRAVTLCG